MFGARLYHRHTTAMWWCWVFKQFPTQSDVCMVSMVLSSLLLECHDRKRWILLCLIRAEISYMYLIGAVDLTSHCQTCESRSSINLRLSNLNFVLQLWRKIKLDTRARWLGIQPTVDLYIVACSIGACLSPIQLAAGTNCSIASQSWPCQLHAH